MNSSKISQSFPTIARLLNRAVFEDECLCAEKLPIEELQKHIHEASFRFAPLITLLCGAINPDWRNIDADTLEADLGIVIGTVGVDRARAVFRDKLLVKDENTVEDTRYELAATAKACRILDSGSIDLERLIPGTKKNSDIFGAFQGLPVRIEVTTLHEKPHLSIDVTLADRIEETKLSSSFDIELRSSLQDEKETDEAIARLIDLHQHHLTTGGETVEIDKVRFVWSDGRYEVNRGLFETVTFSPVREFSTQRGRVFGQTSVTPLVPKNFREVFPLEEGMVDAFSLQHAGDPMSKKIRDMIGGKAKQCEQGLINIVAFGNPGRHTEADLKDALFGARYYEGRLTKDENGYNQLGEGSMRRMTRAPFVPRQYLPDPEHQEAFIDPFTIISGVWHLRLGTCPLNEIIPNPNADVELPVDLARILAL